MKIRVYLLAKQLGISARQLIDCCEAAGVELKNSALAALSQREVDHVLATHPHLLRSQPTSKSSALNAEVEGTGSVATTRRQRLYAQPCQQAHRQLLAGRCPWCGEAIIPRK